MELVEHAAVKAEDIRFMLRGRTRREHEDLDSHPAFLAMTDGTLTLAQYRQVMNALHRIYSVLDPLIGAACDTFEAGAMGFSYEPRSGLLADDLGALSAHPVGRATPVGPAGALAKQAPAIASAPALAGVLYVVEGSVLGGAVLHRATRRLLGDGPERGNGYWAWCAEEGGGRWGMTCRLLSQSDGPETLRAEMVDAARATFAFINFAFRPLRLAMENHQC